jgi:glycosyltransferase involved in cell wall biosynthesis
MTDCFQPTVGDSVRAKHGIPSDAFVIGTVANLLPIKGYETMIRAMASIRIKIPTAHYLIVGGGTEPYVGHLKDLCAEQGVADRVHLVGFQNQTRPYLAAMDVYVQPSRDEAFGIAAVEAMAMGKTVVATRVGGLPEVVEEGRTGFLVPPEDTSAISATITTLFHDQALNEEMGRRGKVRAREHFDLERTLAGVEQLYQEVLTRRRTQ